MTDKNLGDAQEWWRNMTEDQKDFWYAAREKETAVALGRRLKATKWFMWPAIYMLFTLWVWTIRSGDHWWGAWMTLSALTVMLLRGLWMYWITFRDEPRHDREGLIREFRRNRGVGVDKLGPHEGDGGDGVTGIGTGWS